MPFQENKPGSRAIYELFVNFLAHTAKNITVRICTVTIWSTFLCRFRKTIFFANERVVFLIRDQNVVIQCVFCKRFLFFVTRIRKRNKLTPFMPRKPLYEELSGAVGCFCRQAGGEAVPLPAPVHNCAAGGSLSGGPWNKCLACGWGFDIFVIFHFRHERRKHSSAFVTKIFRSAVYNFRTKILRQKNLAPAD